MSAPGPTAPTPSRTPLMEAVLAEDLARVTTLLADVQPVSCFEFSPVTERNNYGDTALMLAAGGGSPAIVRLLLDKGADVNQENSRQQTALFSARTTEMLDLLLERGAVLDERHQAYLVRGLVDGGREDLALHLLGRGLGDRDDILGSALFAVPPRLALADRLVELGARVEPRLMVGSWRRTPGIAWLVAHGVNVNHQDGSGQTALMWVASGGNVEVVAWLLEHGARVDLRDHTGRTAREWASPTPTHQRPEIVALLDAHAARG